MRGVVACVAAAVIAAGTAYCSVETSFAQTAKDGETAQRFLFFSGVDLWSNGGFGHGGLLWSPAGLDHEGFTLKTLLGAGTYKYHTGATEVTGMQFLGAVMPGWRFKRDAFEVTAFVGLDVQNHRLRPDDAGNQLRGTHAGLRGGFDLWWEPSKTTMAAASVSLSTVGSSYWTRGAYGWRVFDLIYLGPEAQALGNTTYHQYRLGLHATAFKTGQFEWSAGAGFASDSDHRSGAYGRIGMLARR
jgi:hypothetical protein